MKEVLCYNNPRFGGLKMENAITLLDNYIELAYSVNLMNSTINMLKNGIYVSFLKNTYEHMKEELPEMINQSHAASGKFLHEVCLLNSDEKASLAVLLLEKAAQCQQVIDELNIRLEELVKLITERNGVVPSIVDGAIPIVSARKNTEVDELESMYIDVFQEKEKIDFAHNIYTNYAAYLGYTRNHTMAQ